MMLWQCESIYIPRYDFYVYWIYHLILFRVNQMFNTYKDGHVLILTVDTKLLYMQTKLCESHYYEA